MEVSVVVGALSLDLQLVHLFGVCTKIADFGVMLGSFIVKTSKIQ
jgi:hypothetical protein